MHIFADQERHFFSNDDFPDATIERAFGFLKAHEPLR